MCYVMGKIGADVIRTLRKTVEPLLSTSVTITSELLSTKSICNQIQKPSVSIINNHGVCADNIREQLSLKQTPMLIYIWNHEGKIYNKQQSEHCHVTRMRGIIYAAAFTQLHTNFSGISHTYVNNSQKGTISLRFDIQSSRGDARAAIETAYTLLAPKNDCMNTIEQLAKRCLYAYLTQSSGATCLFRVAIEKRGHFALNIKLGDGGVKLQLQAHQKHLSFDDDEHLKPKSCELTAADGDGPFHRVLRSSETRQKVSIIYYPAFGHINPHVDYPPKNTTADLCRCSKYLFSISDLINNFVSCFTDCCSICICSPTTRCRS